jgi:hypothetical protein
MAMVTLQGTGNIPSLAIPLPNGVNTIVGFDTLIFNTGSFSLAGPQLRVMVTGTYEVTYSAAINYGTGLTATIPIQAETAVAVNLTTVATGSHVVQTIPPGTPGFTLQQGTTFVTNFNGGVDLTIAAAIINSSNSFIPSSALATSVLANSMVVVSLTISQVFF